MQIPEFLFFSGCSAAAAEHAICPTSETMLGFSGDNTERSKEAGLQLISQLLTRISAGHICFASWSRPLLASCPIIKCYPLRTCMHINITANRIIPQLPPKSFVLPVFDLVIIGSRTGAEAGSSGTGAGAGSSGITS